MLVNLSDVTFVIPLKIDSKDRLFNIELIIDYLRRHFDTNIFVGEDETDLPHNIKNKCDKYFRYNFGQFHRARILNCLYKEVKTPIICNYDTDVLFDLTQYISSVESIKNNHDISYPYSGKFMDVKREYHKKIREDLCILFLSDINHHIRHHDSLGGAFFFKTELLYKGVMENENFKTWGCEDRERYYRFNTLGFKITRILGNLYHLIHHRDSSCNIKSEGCLQGKKEFEKISKMNKEEILQYMSTWRCMQK